MIPGEPRSPGAFLSTVEAVFACLLPFDRAELGAFLEAAWPLVEDEDGDAVAGAQTRLRR